MEVVELRYSLNGISESQLQLLFSNLEKLDSQVIIKRLSNNPSALSIDDMILEGIFSNELIGALSRGFPPPLSFKIQIEENSFEELKRYCSFEWRENPVLLCGISLLPFSSIKPLVPYENPWQFLRLITTSEAASILKPILAVKPKGLIAINKNIAEFILPIQRIDFLAHWIAKLTNDVIDMDWLSGSTGELSKEFIKSVGSISQDLLSKLETRLEQTSLNSDISFDEVFQKALRCLDA